jgi:hypothetical protein
MTTTLQYYSGNRALDCNPTEGHWVGDIFTAADGSVWTVDPDDNDPHPAVDGSDVHYLLPVTVR